MDTCSSCKSVITERYFRVRSEISCASCARAVAEDAERDPTPFLLKGIFTAFIAACIGLAIRAGFEGLIGLAGDAGGIIGMLLRWFVLIFIAKGIVRGAKTGSEGRGGALLQVFSVLLFYLAMTLALVPVILLKNPNLPHTVASFRFITIACLASPFAAFARNPLATTGLVAIAICIGVIWSGTTAPLNPVDGPFEPTVPGEEPNFFKRSGTVPSIDS